MTTASPLAAAPGRTTSRVRRWAMLPLSALGVAAAACTDSTGATAPSSPPNGATLALAPAPSSTALRVVSESSAGDTVVLVFVVGTGVSKFDLGGKGTVQFLYAMASICDPKLSSYGDGTWDSPCKAVTKPVQLTAKTWTNAAGRTQTDFQLALRFVPGQALPVTL